MFSGVFFIPRTAGTGLVIGRDQDLCVMVLANRIPQWDGAVGVKDKEYSQGERKPALLRQCFYRC